FPAASCRRAMPLQSRSALPSRRLLARAIGAEPAARTARRRVVQQKAWIGVAYSADRDPADRGPKASERVLGGGRQCVDCRGGPGRCKEKDWAGWARTNPPRRRSKMKIKIRKRIRSKIKSKSRISALDAS